MSAGASKHVSNSSPLSRGPDGVGSGVGGEISGSEFIAVCVQRATPHSKVNQVGWNAASGPLSFSSSPAGP